MALNTSWKTQLNILWFGQAILMAMLTMSLPYWPLYIAKLSNFSSGELRFWSAAIYIAPFVSSIFSSPIWGKLGDRYGYKNMVIRASMGLFITQTLIMLVNDVFLILLFRLLQGVLAGFIVAAQAWAVAISPQIERGATIGKLQSATAIGNLSGPLLGGIIATYFGYKAIFSGSSVICATVTILFFLLLSNPPPVKNAPLTKTDKRILTSLSWFNQQILSILVVIVMIQLARAMVTPIFSLFVTEHLGGNDITVGFLYAATGLMIFMTAASWGRFFDKIISNMQLTYLTIASLLFVSALLQILHAYTHTVTGILSLRLLWGICLGGLLPILLRLLVENAADQKTGFYLGLGNSANKLGNLLGIILGALIEAALGYANSFLVTALLYLLAAGGICMQIKLLKISVHGNYNHE